MSERESPDCAAAELARGFGIQCAAWSRRLGADAGTARLVGLAAAALSRATSQGHVCLSLSELEGGPGLPADARAWRATLLASAVVGSADDPFAMPLVLDGGDRLYLHRYFDYERRLAARLVRAAGFAPQPLDAPTRALLGELFGADAAPACDRQKLAAAIALRGRLAVISGGPGTGKTTTVVKLLACLLAREPACRIALAAPTGKAAARLAEAVRRGGAALPPALREHLPSEASTVHRLLGAGPSGYAHDARRPLAIDLLVVDEASMLDLALATRLLDAVPEGARIVLLGDRDQLAAVEAGAVLAEIAADASKSASARAALAEACAAPPARPEQTVPRRPTPIADSVVWLDRNYRYDADSGIGRLAAAVNAGDADGACAALRSGDPALRWIDDAQPGDALPAAAIHGYRAFLDAVARGDAAAAIAAFERFRVLCALREGARGVEGINELLTRHARARLGRPAHERSPWYAGRPVIALRNDALLGLANGDTGLALPDAAGELQVHFPGPDGAPRRIAPARLPEHASAWALTVHKAQGSEFDQVLLVLPEQPSPVLSRELVYTAVTRARERVTIAGSAVVLQSALRSPTRRHSGLATRLAEAAAAEEHRSR